MRPPEVADVVPALRELGAECVDDLTLLATNADVMATLKLKPLTLVKLRTGVSTLGGSKELTPTGGGGAAASDEASIFASIVRFEKAADVQQLVATMYAHGSSAGVQEQGCLVLILMCANNADNRVKAGGAGAIQAVVAALRAHGANAGMQEQGCGALMNMCANNADNQVKAGGAGAIQAVVAALWAHGANAGMAAGLW